MGSPYGYGGNVNSLLLQLIHLIKECFVTIALFGKLALTGGNIQLCDLNFINYRCIEAYCRFKAINGRIQHIIMSLHTHPINSGTGIILNSYNEVMNSSSLYAIRLTVIIIEKLHMTGCILIRYCEGFFDIGVITFKYLIPVGGSAASVPYANGTVINLLVYNIPGID